MFFRNSTKVRVEQERVSREETNRRQGLLRLPAELRNQIYDYLVPFGKSIAGDDMRCKQQPLPALLHVCRQTREDISPIFYGRNIVTINLLHLTLHKWSNIRMRSAANLLPDAGTTCWRRLQVKSSSRCFHDDGYAKLTNMEVEINRMQGTLECRREHFFYRLLEPCCKAAYEAYNKRLIAEMRKAGLHDQHHKLRRHDLERLARRMNENRNDWPKSPKRVVPRRIGYAD